MRNIRLQDAEERGNKTNLDCVTLDPFFIIYLVLIRFYFALKVAQD